MNDYAADFQSFVKAGRIRQSNAVFKIQLFLDKGKNSLPIAKHVKDMQPGEHLPKKLHWNYWAVTISYYSMLYAAKALILSKGYEVSDHDACGVALGYLCVPDQMERDDLELLNQSYLIFEDEYIAYFEDAKTESYTARYSPIQTYTERRLGQMFENASKFVFKISAILA